MLAIDFGMWIILDWAVLLACSFGTNDKNVRIRVGRNLRNQLVAQHLVWQLGKLRPRE